ncbi:MAG: CHAD domain-containing protein [Acidobacteria bacterium]|nr:CHAD domain-containing protein [Acidobacteriota bacterium]
MKGLAHPAWQPEELTPANAARVLPELAESYFTRGDKAAREGTSEEKLHGFRLNAKEFRYTLEAFRPLYGPALDRHIANVRRVQTVLGDLNDCRATAALLERYEAVAFADVEQVRRFLDQERERLRARFAAVWAELYGEERKRRTLKQYLRTRVAAGASAEL